MGIYDQIFFQWHAPEAEKKLPDKLRSRDRIFLLSSLFLLALFTRIPFAGKVLYHLDSINFALALKEYNISVHQPHPPGYFLYIMLGRFINLFVEDANTIFVTISIVFTGLTVVVIFLLGEEIFDLKSGLLAAFIAMTSPNIWFHGEVALTYIAEACISTLIAFCCWKVIKGEENYLWASVIALGLAGGLRQNTPVFLLPLWLYSVKGVPIKKVGASLLVLGLVSISWFVPMVMMTGGWNSYCDALRELWKYSTGGNSVFLRGWPALKLYFTTVLRFTIYGIGVWVYVLCLAGYAKIREGKAVNTDYEKVTFLLIWALPSVLFYTFVFIHPGNPGYALIFLPPLILLTSISLQYLVDRHKNMRRKHIYNAVACLFCAINMVCFLFVDSPVSYRNITRQDHDLKIVLENLRTYNSLNTVLFSEEYLFFGFRHLMYYLPEYKTFMVDIGSDKKIKSRNIFYGVHGKTFRARSVFIENDNTEFAALCMIGRSWKNSPGDGDINVKQLTPSLSVASGPVRFLNRIYPGLEERIDISTRRSP